MTREDLAWEGIIAGHQPWPWAWPGLAGSASPERVARLARSLAATPDASRRGNATEALWLLAGDARVFAMMGSEATIAALIDALELPPARLLDVDRLSAARQAIEGLLGRLAPRPWPQLRALLDGPPRPVPAVFRRSPATGRRGRRRRPVAAVEPRRLASKNAALRLLEKDLGPDDLPRLECLWRNDEEPSDVRNHAVEQYLRFCGAANAADVAHFLRRHYRGRTQFSEFVPPAPLSVLVAYFIQDMTTGSPFEAHLRLIDCGPAAVEPLLGVLRESPDPAVRRHARAALEQLAPDVLADELARHEATSRGLSPAAEPAPDVSLGLSRPSDP